MMNYWEPFGNIKGQKKEKKEGCGKGGRFCLIWKKLHSCGSNFIINYKFKN
jgi:hypothetical protein